MTVTIVFESHSTSTDNEAGIASGWLDPELSETGKQQAAELGKRRSDVDAVYTSDLKRSVQTATIAFGDRFVIDARLRESDYGSMSGVPRREITQERAGRIAVPFPDGESLLDVVERVRAFVDDVSGKHDGQRILVIGHYATHIALDHLLAGVPLEEAVIDRPWHDREYIA